MRVDEERVKSLWQGLMVWQDCLEHAVVARGGDGHVMDELDLEPCTPQVERACRIDQASAPLPKCLALVVADSQTRRRLRHVTARRLAHDALGGHARPRADALEVAPAQTPRRKDVAPDKRLPRAQVVAARHCEDAGQTAAGGGAVDGGDVCGGGKRGGKRGGKSRVQGRGGGEGAKFGRGGRGSRRERDVMLTKAAEIVFGTCDRVERFVVSCSPARRPRVDRAAQRNVKHVAAKVVAYNDDRRAAARGVRKVVWCQRANISAHVLHCHLIGFTRMQRLTLLSMINRHVMYPTATRFDQTASELALASAKLDECDARREQTCLLHLVCNLLKLHRPPLSIRHA
mmetsp:Transcript_5321/g.11553  ORF Transcript_5321/g.11553 Transcript_5321/m.11553 type:complete len:344 (-) Transcript_5321:581-1612(-)|eukprot:2092273-Pleurochrysis_carterae.AAC.7